MIPLSRIHWSPKIGLYMGVAEKNANFVGQKLSKIGSGGYQRARRATL